MDKLEKSLTKTGDERENYYNGLASRVAFVATVAVAGFMFAYYLFKYFALNDTQALMNANLVMIPINVGLIAYFALIIKWKITKSRQRGTRKCTND